MSSEWCQGFSRFLVGFFSRVSEIDSLKFRADFSTIARYRATKIRFFRKIFEPCNACNCVESLYENNNNNNMEKNIDEELTK